MRESTSSSDRKPTATNRMHTNEACGMKCCYFLFHSDVNFLRVHYTQESDRGSFGPLFVFLVGGGGGGAWTHT